MFIKTAWHLPTMMTSVLNSLPLGGVISRMRTSPWLNQTDETARCIEGDPCNGECHPDASSILSMDVTSRAFMVPSGPSLWGREVRQPALKPSR